MLEDIIARENLKDEVYSDSAAVFARMSRDENTKVGALIVAADGTSVSWGYNGTIAGFDDEVIPHSREKKTIAFYEQVKPNNPIYTEIVTDKYPFMAHAESNAIHYASGNPKLPGSILYVTGFPCEKCALEIARAGIKKVVVKSNNDDKQSMTNMQSPITKYIFAAKGIKLVIEGETHKLWTSPPKPKD